jgi:hypothetical protein
MNQRRPIDVTRKRSLGMSPEAAYLMEKPHLASLPPYIPPVYQTLDRTVDLEGYVHVDTNRYSMPEWLIGKEVEVHKRLWTGQRSSSRIRRSPILRGSWINGRPAAARLISFKYACTIIAEEIRMIPPEEKGRLSGLINAAFAAAEHIVAVLKEVRT